MDPPSVPDRHHLWAVQCSDPVVCRAGNNSNCNCRVVRKIVPPSSFSLCTRGACMSRSCQCREAFVLAVYRFIFAPELKRLWLSQARCAVWVYLRHTNRVSYSAQMRSVAIKQLVFKILWKEVFVVECIIQWNEPDYPWARFSSHYVSNTTNCTLLRKLKRVIFGHGTHVTYCTVPH